MHIDPLAGGVTLISPLPQITLLVMLRRLYMGSGLGTWPLTLVTAMVLAEPLPTPVDVPRGPEGTSIDDSDACPSASQLDELALGAVSYDPINSPVLAHVTPIAAADETLSATGIRLAGATLLAWDGKFLRTIAPLRTANDRLQAIMPSTVADGHTSEGPQLLWPLQGARVGNPIRINAPSLWWVWPRRVVHRRPHQVLRLFGRQLHYDGPPPTVVISGHAAAAQRVLKARIASRSELSVDLPEDLAQGIWRVQVHLGSLGKWGWSEEVEFEVVVPEAPLTTIVKLSDFDPSPEDAGPAIEAAIAETASQGGGTILFGSGVYRFTRPIVLPADHRIDLVGAGQANVDPSKPIDARPSGTIIYFEATDNMAAAFRLTGAGSTISDMTIISAGPTDPLPEGQKPGGSCIELAGLDQTARGLQLIRLGPSRYWGLIRCIGTGPTQQRIVDNQFHAYESAVRVEDRNDYVLVARCDFIGWYDRGPGTDSNAFVSRGGNNIILEDNHFRSRDRDGGRVFCRSALFYTSDIRYCVVQRNTIRSTGPHPSIPGINLNTGEQILFHARAPRVSPQQVVDASSNSITVGGDLPKISFSEQDWIVFVVRGTGIGQWRIITGQHHNTLTLQKNWRLAPASDSIVNIQGGIRNNLVLNNTIAGDLPQYIGRSSRKQILPGMGVAWWFNAYDNVTADNTFNDCGGLYITGSVALTSSWNLVRDNTHRSHGGRHFISHYAYPILDTIEGISLGWYGVGNVFRRNTSDVDDAEAVLRAGWSRPEVRLREETPFDLDTGLALAVFEHNRFTGVRAAGYFGPPMPWLLWRSNNARRSAGASSPVSVLNRAALLEPLIVDSDQLASDESEYDLRDEMAPSFED